MAREDREISAPKACATADISLVGSVDEAMACKLRDGLIDPAPGDGPLTVDMTTLGGDPEMARRMIVEIDAARHRLHGRLSSRRSLPHRRYDAAHPLPATVQDDAARRSDPFEHSHAQGDDPPAG